MTKTAFDDFIAGLDPAVNHALHIAFQCGTIDGEHHKMWAIDQMVRALTGEHYAEWVRRVEDGEDGPKTYEWDEGIAP